MIATKSCIGHNLCMIEKSNCFGTFAMIVVYSPLIIMVFMIVKDISME